MHPIVDEVRRRDALLFGVGLPAVLLPVVYVAASLLPVVFGNVIFGLSIVTCLGWILLGLNDRTGPRKSDTRSLLSRRSSRFGDVGQASRQQLLSMTKLLFSLTGLVILGWLSLLTL